MPFRLPSADPGRVIFLVCCIALAGLGPLYVWWNRPPSASDKRPNPEPIVAEPSEELLALRAENQLLLAMLGAVKGRVVILGPTRQGGKASGKIAWDEARQAGFIHLSDLDPLKPGVAYRLVGLTRNGSRVGCGTLTVTQEGAVASPFEPESRLLGADRFEVVLTVSAPGNGTETVVLRGGGGE
ncbi:MAG: hypothetical protein OHK005_07040 [Candidatus Methylacidiphilales bacterium]